MLADKRLKGQTKVSIALLQTRLSRRLYRRFLRPDSGSRVTDIHLQHRVPGRPKAMRGWRRIDLGGYRRRYLRDYPKVLHRLALMRLVHCRSRQE